MAQIVIFEEIKSYIYFYFKFCVVPIVTTFCIFKETYNSYHNSQSITKRYAERALRVRVVFAEVKAGAALEGSANKISLFLSQL